jgi:RimJ/RimL family protein N-acetyltransferase
MKPTWPTGKKILNDKTIVTRTILADGEVAGNAVSWSQDGHREIGYWIGRSFWGKGVATAALGQFLQVIDERPHYAWVARHNAASIRVLERFLSCTA